MRANVACLGYDEARGTWLLPASGTPQLLIPGSVRSRGLTTTGAGSPDTGEFIGDLAWSPDWRG
jgi:hypothetical protein